ncbi:MAG: hypothetical protein ACD_63C00169G0001, partial [uncultured bacterium]
MKNKLKIKKIFQRVYGFLRLCFKTRILKSRLESFFSAYKAPVLVFLCSIAVVLFLPHAAIAEARGPSMWNQEELIGWVFLQFAVALGKLLALISMMFEFVIKDDMFSNFLGNAAVDSGWKITVGVANMAFVLVLLAIGFATILRVPSYHIKKLIVPFIAAVLLINFSKLISGVVLDFCNIIMVTFTDHMKGGNIGGYFAKSMGVQDWFLVKGCPQDGCGTGIFFQTIFVVIVFEIALMIALLFLSVFFVIRFITLLILIILSPFAYVAMILPSTKDFTGKWWKMFLQNAFYGPVAVFMVYLAVDIVLQMVSDMPEEAENAAGTIFTNGINMQTLLKLIVVVVLLYKAVDMSKGMGIAGAGAVMNFGKKRWEGVKDRSGYSAWKQAREKAKKKKGAERFARIHKPVGKVTGGIRRGLGRIPIVGGFIRRGGVGGEVTKAANAVLSKQEEDAAKSLKTESMTNEELSKTFGNAVSKDKKGKSPETRALALEMAKRGLLGGGANVKKRLAAERALSKNGSMNALAQYNQNMLASSPTDVLNPMIERAKLEDVLKKADIDKLGDSEIRKPVVMAMLAAKQGPKRLAAAVDKKDPEAQ